jgi:hypothetical protein
MNDDYIVDNLDDNDPKKKKIKSGRKGKRGELLIVKRLNARFSELLSENNWGCFSRSVGSGNRWGQNVVLSNTASSVYSGDLTCPENFKFVVESKNGYNKVDLVKGKAIKTFQSFLKQVTDDASRCGRKPVLVWKKDRQKAMAFFRSQELEEYFGSDFLKDLFSTCLYYNDWVGVPLDETLDSSSKGFLTDDFWFRLSNERADSPTG